MGRSTDPAAQKDTAEHAPLDTTPHGRTRRERPAAASDTPYPAVPRGACAPASLPEPLRPAACRPR